jgi:hypothetical protein
MSFKGFLEAVGRDFKKITPWVTGVGEAAISTFLPALAPAVNATINTIVTVEQKYAALNTQTGTGAQKLQDVLNITGPLLAVMLKDAGKANDTAAVTNVINELVNILNLAPAPAGA